jgi:tetratricopeptide (TPR) repeat protein
MTAVFSPAALAISPEPGKELPPVDPATCLAAIAANDDDNVVAACGPVIDNEKAAKADRIKALVARASAFGRKDQLERAIADDDAALRLDPALADTFNDRGELWWKRGDRPKALADFAAAIRLNPNHPAAKANYRRLALELERLGALMAVYGKPSFNCATARKPVEKAICADPELANLDREINAANTRVMREAASDNPRTDKARQREQDDFLSRRDAEFGKAGYDLQKSMHERLQQLLDIERH